MYVDGKEGGSLLIITKVIEDTDGTSLHELAHEASLAPLLVPRPAVNLKLYAGSDLEFKLEGRAMLEAARAENAVLAARVAALEAQLAWEHEPQIVEESRLNVTNESQLNKAMRLRQSFTANDIQRRAITATELRGDICPFSVLKVRAFVHQQMAERMQFERSTWLYTESHVGGEYLYSPVTADAEATDGAK